MYRYLALLWQPGEPQSARLQQRLRAAAASAGGEWSIACDSPGTCVIHTGTRRHSAQAYPLADGCGVVLGKLFERDRAGYAVPHSLTLDAGISNEIVASGGRHIVEHYWGSYVALVRDESARAHHVFRDPTGNLPCYRARCEGADILFSHVEDCLRLLPGTFAVNRRYFSRWLVYGRLGSRETGLEGVEDLRPGERLTLSGGKLARSQLWDPTQIASSPRLQSVDDAATALRFTVQNTIDAWASCYGRITHKLSGGLDSSIVAGCLAKAPSQPQVSYLNMSIDVALHNERRQMPGIDPQLAAKIKAISGHGDERYFARLVAQRWQSPLIERQRAVDMDLQRLWGVPPAVRPPLYFTMMETDDAEREVIRTHGTEAFFSGQAGDSVLLATVQPLAAIDYGYLHGLRGSLWQQVLATAQLSKESVWTVLRKVLRHGLLRRPYVSPLDVMQLPTLLTQDLRAQMTSSDFSNHLTRLPCYSRLPPGKQNHVNGVASPSFYEFVFDSGAQTDHIDPLNSQPVWELMLRIPTYTILADGVSRGLARHAFADLLPEEIRRRQVKGSGGSFYQHMVRRNREYLREHLLDGRLVADGYLDRHKLAQCLAADDPSLIVPATTILCYLAGEIWLQQWTREGKQGELYQAAALSTVAS